MSDIVLLDTSVYLNVLNVPGFNQDRNHILNVFDIRVQNGDHFLLPMATIWETGNHISRLTTGGSRYQFASKLIDDVSGAIDGNASYRPTYFPEREVFLRWLADFPNYAQRNKRPTRAVRTTSWPSSSNVGWNCCAPEDGSARSPCVPAFSSPVFRNGESTWCWVSPRRKSWPTWGMA